MINTCFYKIDKAIKILFTIQRNEDVPTKRQASIIIIVRNVEFTLRFDRRNAIKMIN